MGTACLWGDCWVVKDMVVPKNILLDNDEYLMYAGLLGAVYVVGKGFRGKKVKASPYERRYLYLLIEEMRKQGIEIGPKNQDLEGVFFDFAEAVHLGPQTHFWNGYFSISPMKIAHDYIAEWEMRQEHLKSTKPKGE